ncbi:MAG: FliA/WhiG family RNA polymerase sigma factor [Armatimonadota bacterium]
MSQMDKLWQDYKQRNDAEAREQIILAHAHLAKKVVDRMHLHPTAAIGYDDLLSHAVLGLIDAVERFDPGREVKFETYARSRIRGTVLDALKSADLFPRSVRSAARQLRQAMAHLENELGRSATDQELAEHMGIGIDDLDDLLADVWHCSVLSLEEMIFRGDEGSVDCGLGMTIGWESDPVQASEMDERVRLLARAIDELPEREKLVIGLYYKEGLTLKEIGLVMEITESRVCQIHSKSIARLHGKLARHADLMLAAA